MTNIFYMTIVKVLGLLLFFTMTIQAAEVHYIGRADFPVSGVKYSEKNHCIWDVEGDVNLILSFSRSTSLAAMRVQLIGTPREKSELCNSYTEKTFYKIPLITDISTKEFVAEDKHGIQKIYGKSGDLLVSGDYTYENIILHSDKPQKDTLNGSFSTSLIKIPGEMIDVKAVKGNILTFFPLGAAAVTDSIIDASTLITDEDSAATLVEQTGNEITLNAKTVLTRIPLKQINNKDLRSYILLHGKIKSKINNRDRDFKIKTPGVSVQVIADKEGSFAPLSKSDIKRIEDDQTVFSTEYKQQDVNGSTTISVETGTVMVTDQDGNKMIMTAGDEQIVTNLVAKTSWVQPADGGILYSGTENILTWTAYPGAAGYIMEFNVPTPVFAEDNTTLIEYEQQAITFTPEMYIEYEGLVFFILELPLLDELPFEMRIYAIDADSQILSETSSSDRSSVMIK